MSKASFESVFDRSSASEIQYAGGINFDRERSLLDFGREDCVRNHAATSIGGADQGDGMHL